MSETNVEMEKCKSLYEKMKINEIRALQDRFMIMHETIEKAKKRVMSKCGDYDRTWLEGNIADSYNDPYYHVAFFVLAGSPPRGYVLADYNTGIVIAYGFSLQKLYTYYAYECVRPYLKS